MSAGAGPQSFIGGLGQSFREGRAVGKDLGRVFRGQPTQAEEVDEAELRRFFDKANLESMAVGAVQAAAIKDPQKRQEFLFRRADQIDARGGDSRDTRQLAQQPLAQQNETLEGMITIAEQAGILKPRAKVAAVKPGPVKTAIGEQGPTFVQQLAPGGPFEQVPGGFKPVPAAGEEISFDSETGAFTVKRGPGVGAGTSGLQKKTLANLEKQAVQKTQQIGRLVSLGKKFERDFLTFQGALEATVTDFQSKAKGFLGLPIPAPSQARVGFASKRLAFKNQVGQEFNLYRKDITGAAASVAELDRLMANYINTKLGPDAFLAAYNGLLKETLRSKRLVNKIRREGITDDFRKQGSNAARTLDQLFLGGFDDDDVDARFNQLFDSGEFTREDGTVDEEAILQNMTIEGYQ